MNGVLLNVLVDALRTTSAIAAVLVTPLLMVRCMFPSLGAASVVPLAGALSIALNALIPVALHVLSVPFAPASLAAVHVSLLLASVVTMRIRHIRILPADASTLRVPALICVLGILLVIPLTPLAGIDTYKWQDLATAVQVECNIPWLVHPAALLGFAPRAYPCAQPLVLATVQTLGNMGVESGYFVVSCLSIATALFASYRLGLALFPQRFALWFAALYTFAPVAMRYHHWSTGRGLFLAVLPLLVVGLLGRTWRHAVLAVGAAAVLLLTHKTAIVAIPILTLGLFLAPGLRRPWRIPLTLASAAAVLIVAGGSFVPSASGILASLRLAAVRLGVLAPLIAMAAFMPDRDEETDATASCNSNGHRKTLTLLLLLFPVAFTPDMYGALMLLPLAAAAATLGLSNASMQWPRSARFLGLAVAALLAFGAVAIVVNRSMDATPRRIREAAVFLDKHDPTGPFRIVAPERIQGRMQAYVRGCPRFSVFAVPGSAADNIRHAVALDSPRAFLSRATAYLRKFLEPPDLATDWYGQTGIVYHVIVDGKGSTPPGAALIYDKDAVRIFRTGGTPDAKSNREPH